MDLIPETAMLSAAEKRCCLVFWRRCLRAMTGLVCELNPSGDKEEDYPPALG